MPSVVTRSDRAQPPCTRFQLFTARDPGTVLVRRILDTRDVGLFGVDLERHLSGGGLDTRGGGAEGDEVGRGW